MMGSNGSSTHEEFIELDDLDLAAIDLEDIDDIAGGTPMPCSGPVTTRCVTAACICWPGRGGGC